MKETTLCLSLVTGGLILLTMACSTDELGPNRITAEEIRGVWETDDARYADRKLEILSEALLFYTEETAFDPYVIHEIQTEVEEDGTRYMIEHSGPEQGRMTLTLFVHTGDSTLIFRNQPSVVWRKTSSEG
jgi:hypothetical protein